MKKMINPNWHKTHQVPMPSTLAIRVRWHEAHLKHCGCRTDVPPTIAAALRKEGKKVCSRGHVYSGKSPCPLCWPGRKQRIKK